MNEVMKEIAEIKAKFSKNDLEKIKDSKCPFTGNVKLRGKIFTGVVVSKDTHRTAQVEWTKRYFVKKYERFTIKKTKIAAHNPELINANVGDLVMLAECRPLSKTKKFIIIKKIKRSKKFMVKKEIIDEDKKVSRESKSKSSKSSEAYQDDDKQDAKETLDKEEMLNKGEAE